MCHTVDRVRAYISIHALLAESDTLPESLNFSRCISIHALLAESDQSLSCLFIRISHFYPRSPCGERRPIKLFRLHFLKISIHALLAESDNAAQATNADVASISIHALLAESDRL